MEFLQKKSKYLFLILVIILTVLMAPHIYNMSPEEFLNYSPASPFRIALVIILLYALKSVILIIPVSVIYIATGIIFPTGWAILIGYTGLSIELSLGWFIGRWLGREKVEKMIRKSKKAEKLLQYIETEEQTVSFITRLLPMPYPIDLGSMLFGATEVPFFRHLLFSLFGISSTMLPFTIAASSLEYPVTWRFFIPLGISGVMFFGLFLIYRRWSKTRKKNCDRSSNKSKKDTNKD